MPLKVRLKPLERIVINGAVLRNDDKRTTLTVEVESAQIIRESDILKQADATTPAKQAYFAVQQVIMNPDFLPKLEATIVQMLAMLHTTLASLEAKAKVMEAMNYFGAGDYYKTLTCLKAVIAKEEEAELAS
jgi:flagellar protein FlbT